MKKMSLPENSEDIDSRSLGQVLAKILQRGPGWTARRVLYEIRVPTTKPGRIIRNGLIWIEKRLHTVRSGFGDRGVDLGLRGGKSKTLLAMYDLDVLPPTFDIASFLFLAELERRKQRLDQIHLVVIPGRNLEPQNTGERALPNAMRQMRVGSILFPVSRLLPSCAGVTLCASRSDISLLRLDAAAVVFPHNASPTFPIAPDQSAINDPALAEVGVFPVLTAPTAELQAVKTWLHDQIGDRLPVVISLRESKFMSARNSNLAEWIKFADNLDKLKFAPIFVRDTERVLEHRENGLERHTVFESASWNIALRMALYQSAYVNMAVMHGAMELCWFNESSRYAAFMPVGTSPQTSVEFLASRGFVEGKSLPFAKPWQMLVWRPQTYSDIEQVFNEIVRKIEDSPSR